MPDQITDAEPQHIIWCKLDDKWVRVPEEQVDEVTLLLCALSFVQVSLPEWSSA